MTAKRLIARLLGSKISSFKMDLQSIHDLYLLDSRENTSALDLGCGPIPQNKFKANDVVGIDLVENKKEKVTKCKLGYEKLPFDKDSFDYLTAYDLIEHIPRFSEISENGPPFIFFMNECYRVLKPGGIFLSMTPIYPYFGAFQDPTHNNIITVDTFKLYFSEKKYEIAHHYGITSNFKIIEQKMYGQHLIAVMTK
tara:strand:+ start:90 stop:677 length:588 start_codon:yes stop_codon:yes gene_type:complete